MRQIFYIDIDEEMISVIGRLRRSPARENVIVLPKRAIVLQSVVNLRLLQHEVKKLGKTIIVVTQDEQGRALCEKIGISAQPALEEEGDISRHTLSSATRPVSTSESSLSAPLSPHASSLQQEDTASPVRLPHSQSIGSSDFFAAAPIVKPSLVPEQQPLNAMRPPLPVQARDGETRKIEVRDRNPKYLTALNSKLVEEQTLHHQEQRETTSQPTFAQAMPGVSGRPIFHPSHPQPTSQEAGGVYPGSPAPHLSQNIFSAHPPLPRASLSTTAPAQEKKKQEPKSVTVPGGGRLKALFLFFGMVSLLSVGGVGAYVFLPKAEISVQLKSVSQKADLEFQGSSEVKNYSAESRVLPLRLIEKDQDVTLSFPATGKTSLADQKARGSIIISNDYNAEPQTLVASTRLVSQDGKMFRLLNGVTVPGKTDSPGVIEAAVIADQSGAEYNIEATTFTIPGFEGSPKYAKFSGKSLKPMLGGGTSGSNAASVSEQDIEQAKREIESKVDEAVGKMLEDNVVSGEKILNEAVEKTVLKSSASPQAGAITDTFEYHVIIHVRALVFSENDIKRMAAEIIEKQPMEGKGALASKEIRLEYGEPSFDFSAKTADIKVHAVDILEAKIDIEALKTDLVGRDENDINSVLQKYPEIEKVSINIWPDFLSSKIPSRKNRVTLSVESAFGNDH